MKRALLILGLFVATVTVSTLNLPLGMLFAGVTVGTLSTGESAGSCGGRCHDV